MIAMLPRVCALLLSILLAFPALAQEKPAKPDEVERLVQTLESEADRARLVGQLKALVAAQRGEDRAEEQGLLGSLSERVEALGGEVMEAVAVVKDAPRLVTWAGARFGDAAIRAQWGAVVVKLALVLAAGILADRAATWVLRRPLAKLNPYQDVGSLLRLGLGSARAAIRLVPVAAFAGTGLGALSLLGLAGNAKMAALMLITAYASVRAVMVLVRLLVAPRSPHLRLLPMDDETAEYCEIWSRRLVGLGMFGFLAIEAAVLLGLPKGGQMAAAKAVGLAVATMVAIFILQNRHAVASWLRGNGQGGERLRLVKARLADVWHVLAVLYVAAAYMVWALRIKGGFEFMVRATLLSLVILGAAALISGALRRGIERGFALSHDTRERFPLLEARANRYLPLLHVVLRGTVAMVTVLALAQAWGLDMLGLVSSPVGRRVLASSISIGLVLVAALVVWEVVSGAIERYLGATDGDGKALERSSRARTLLPLARNALLVFLGVMVMLIVLAELGINVAPLLAGAGVVGIAIGFGSQKLVQDVITGAFILFEDSIAVGDVIKVDAHSGVVEAISIRAIRLRDINGSVHTIPFSAVGTVVNMSRDFAYALLEVGVAYREDTDHVTEVLVALSEEMRADPVFGPDIVEPLEVMGVERFDASAVVIRVRFKTMPLRQWAVTREFNRRMKKRFDDLGIEIPFPQTTLWFGEDRQGRAPAARLRLEGAAEAT